MFGINYQRITYRHHRNIPKKEWTQKYAATVFGITSGALSNYERGERTPDAEMLKRIAEIYDVSIDYLLIAHHLATIRSFIFSNVAGPMPDTCCISSIALNGPFCSL